jgi:hypothetical protein
MPDINKSFDILNLSPNAPYEDAKAAYRELASILHPDKHMHNEQLRVRATEKFQQLQNAWSELEAYYKNPGVIDKVHYERNQREEQQRKSSESERRAEEERRAEAVRFEARRRASSYAELVEHKCHNCNMINKYPRSVSINIECCSACGKYLNKDRYRAERFYESGQAQLRAQETKAPINRRKLKSILSVYTLGYILIICNMGIAGFMLFSVPWLLLSATTFMWIGGFFGEKL